jgi:site-specific DNA-methyltransferase (adenine-specific)
MMKAYYSDNHVTIYHGDCREILPELPIPDVVITDPVWPNCPPDLLEGAGDPSGLFREMLESLPSLPRRLVVVMRSDSDPRFLSVVPDTLPFFRCQILPYVMPGYIGRKLGGDEIAYSFGEPIPSSEGKRVVPGYAPKAQPGNRKANGHPCSRVLEHFQFLCKWWTLRGETVIDPFMGSGTTLVATRTFDVKAIGIEVDERYCEIAAERQIKARVPLFV